jgi:hypothetical protein
MNITSAQYVSADIYGTVENISIKCVVDGKERSVPLSEGNSDYDEIMRQVEAGELTIADAE